MFEEIFKLIEKGELNKAQETIDKTPENDPKRYNVSGLIYYQKKELEKAKEEFEKGLKIDAVDSDLLFNYGYLLKEMNQEKEAWRYLMRIHKKDWATYDMLGDIEFKNRSKLSALRFYKKAAELTDSPEEMKKKFLDMRNNIKQDTKIAFLCLPGLDNFLKDIVETFSLGYDVRLVVTKDGNQIAEAIKWADIVWLEWANDLAIFATNNVPEIQNKKVVCRLHGYEIFGGYPQKINWEMIDKLIFVNNHKKELFEKIYTNAKVEKVVVDNGIDLDKFTFNIHQKNHNLLIMGNINYRKGFETLLLCFEQLLKEDDRYKLYIKGKFQDLRYEDYILNAIKEMNIERNVTFIDKYIEDIDSWGEQFGYILSTSIEESFHYTVGEFMAKGIKPVINSWPSAREVWSNEFIFTTVDQFKEKILEDKYNSEGYRRFIEDNYPLEKQIDLIEGIINLVNKRGYKKENNQKIQSDKEKEKIYHISDSKDQTKDIFIFYEIDENINNYNNYYKRIFVVLDDDSFNKCDIDKVNWNLVDAVFVKTEKSREKLLRCSRQLFKNKIKVVSDTSFNSILKIAHQYPISRDFKIVVSEYNKYEDKIIVGLVEYNLQQKTGHCLYFLLDYLENFPDIDFYVFSSESIDSETYELLNKYNNVKLLPILKSDYLYDKKILSRYTNYCKIILFLTADNPQMILNLALNLESKNILGLIFHSNLTFLNVKETRFLHDKVISSNIYTIALTPEMAKGFSKVLPKDKVLYFNEIYPLSDYMEKYYKCLNKDIKDIKEFNVLYNGVARTEKGFHMLPEIITNSPENYTFHLNVSPLSSGRYEKEVIETFDKLELLRKKGKKIIYYKDLTVEQYTNLFYQSHAILILYNSILYSYRLSGIVLESFATKTPMVINKDIWYYDELVKPYNLGIGVDINNVSNIISALEEIRLNYNSFLSNFNDNFVNYINKRNTKIFLKKFISYCKRNSLMK